MVDRHNIVEQKFYQASDEVAVTEHLTKFTVKKKLQDRQELLSVVPSPNALK